MKKIAVLMVLVCLALVGCGSKSSSSSSGAGAGAQPAQSAPNANKVHLAKTKFVLHAGLAFGAFHHFIYKPYREGKLGGGLLRHKAAKVKAALAALFAYHEVRKALDAARGSKLLSKALAPLLALQTKLGSMRSGLGHGDTSQVAAANADAARAGSASSAAGQPVTEQVPSSLSSTP